MSILRFKEANCQNCYKCIRNCPIKAIELKNNQAQIIEKECVLCGRCVLVCPQNAKDVRNDTAKVKALLASDKPVIASVAPSYIGNYGVPDFAAFRSLLCRLGFADAYETAEGAYIVKSEYEKLMEAAYKSVMISSCCPTVLKLIQKYHPKLVANLAPVVTPMEAHGRLILQRHPEAAVVFIGPCFSKKDEAAHSDAITYALTFDELTGWLEEKGISLPGAEVNSDKQCSRFFPTSGGILKTLKANSHYKYITVDGMENCIDAIHEIEEGHLDHCFIEMSACVGSCVNGPSIRRHTSSIIAAQMRVHEVSAGTGDFGIAYDLPLEQAFRTDTVNPVMPGENAIRDIMKKMGKTKPEDELNCGTCGYPTCRDKAIAVYFGKAEISMCLPYMKKKAESFSDNIINATPNAIVSVDSSLCIQQINAAACQMFSLPSAKEVIGKPVSDLMDPAAFESMFSSEEEILFQKAELAPYGVVAEQTFVYDNNGRIAICIMKDVTQEEVVNQKNKAIKDEAAEITDKVIQKQMRVVQEIASLLGETTAETKIALTKLKNTIMIDE